MFGSSTTVVVMQLRVVYSANSGRYFDASGATWTRPKSVPRAAVWPVRGPRRGGECRTHAAAREPSGRLDGREAARWGLGPRFLGCLLGRQVGSPQDGQQGICPHRQRDMTIPACPTAHRVPVQTNLAFRLCKTLFHGPAAASHLHDACQGCRMSGKDHICRQLWGGAQPPAHQEPAAPLGRHRRGQGAPLPRIPAGGLWPPRRHSTGPSLLAPAPPGWV